MVIFSINYRFIKLLANNDTIYYFYLLSSRKLFSVWEFCEKALFESYKIRTIDANITVKINDVMNFSSQSDYIIAFR